MMRSTYRPRGYRSNGVGLIVLAALLLPLVLGWVAALWWTVFVGMLHGTVLPSMVPVGWRDLYGPCVFLAYSFTLGGVIKSGLSN